MLVFAFQQRRREGVMKKDLSKLITLFLTASTLSLSPQLARAQDTAIDDDDSGEIIVTGAMRVRQGGAQDIKHFRSIAADVGMPRPESLTVEGLMGEHDLTIPAASKCEQLFCLVSEAMPAALPTRPGDQLFVGLGFTSNVDAATWKREPLNLVAVVDKSGSMDGAPLSLVRNSLRQIVGQMNGNDRISIILYGDQSHVYLQPTTLAGNRDAVLDAIAAIESAGSTNMEAGLQVGYETAFADAPGFKGNTRMMLFTDEQPNVGNTDAGSFMGIAEAASKRGIGLTTIGVGVQFDGALATKVSSVRGGNLFFIANNDDVKTVFAKQLDTMVSEIAHNVKMTLAPVEGYKISGIFGVPADTMTETASGTIDITVPTAFLSTNGGGIFLTLAKAEDRRDLPAALLATDAALLRVGLSYTAAKTGQAGTDTVSVAQASPTPSAPMKKAQSLVDEYLVMKDATTAFHMKGDPKTAYRLLSGLSARLETVGLDSEKKLVGDMTAQAALYSGYGGELPKSMRHLSAVGTWEVTRASGFEDLTRGDRLQFTPNRDLLTFRKKVSLINADDREDYEINERELHMVNSRLVFTYEAEGDTMRMRVKDDNVYGTGASLVLKKVASIN
jgi:Ca-activated chloride channel homolog